MFRFALVCGAVFNVAIGLIPPIDAVSGLNFTVAIICILVAIAS